MSKTKAINPEQEKAVKFANCMRGQLIIGQALYIALQEMKKRPDIRREYSNEDDMQYLIDNLYPLYSAIAKASEVEAKRNLFGRLSKDIVGRLSKDIAGRLNNKGGK